jgi:3-phosphoshikimate 1-carboxyvinyltransferase
LHLRRQGSDLLENMLRHFEIDLKVERDDDKDADELTRRIARQMRAAGKEPPVTRVRLPAARPSPAFVTLAGDVSEASIAALAATLSKGSDLLLEGVLLNPGRGGLLAALRRMGADIEATQRRERFGEVQGTLRVRASEIFAKRFDADTVADLRDEVFLLLAAATAAEGETVFRDLDWLRLGPVDLLRDFTAALKRGGVETGEIEDGLVIRGRGESDGGQYDALGHPGLAAACAVLALKSHGASTLAGADILEWRHPGLLERLVRTESQASAATAEKPA